MSLAAARALAAGGWPVFPTKNKQPLTPNGFKGATKDLAVVDGWWTENPEAQIAIAIPPGQLVVDIDTCDGTPSHPHDGFAALAQLEAKHGPLPPTLTSVSGREGQHRWFSAPPGLDLIQRKIAPGIDTRIGGKGYVVAPPSMHHESGKPYRWADANIPIAAAPQWLLDALQDQPPEQISNERVRKAREHLSTLAPAISGQAGHDRTFGIVERVVRGFCLTDAEATTALADWNARCEPPWSTGELLHKIRDGREKGDTLIGELLNSVPNTSAFEVLDAAAIFAPLPEIKYLVKGIGITTGAPMLIAGYGYSGKTAAVQQLAIDLARLEPTDRDWMNPRPVWGTFPATRRARVLHVDYEQGGLLTRWRYQRLATAAGVTGAELQGWLQLITLPRLYLNTPNGFAALERLCEGVDLVIVDSFRAANPGLEENSSDAREPLDALNLISEKHGCSSVVIHHARKPTKDAPGGTKMTVRGSGAIFDGSGSVLIFEGEKDQPKHVSHEKEKSRGTTVEDFELVIEDVDGGLRVRASNIPVKTAVEKSNEELQADMAAVRVWLEKNMFFKNRDQISKALAISKTRASAAIGALETTREITQSGSYRDRAYHLSGIKPNGVE